MEANRRSTQPFASSILLFCVLFLTSNAFPQILGKDAFRLGEPPESGLASNSITDIKVFQNNIWLGTGDGLSRTNNDGLSFETFRNEQGIGRGGVSGLAISDDGIWVATGFDSTARGERLQTGGGLAYSIDDGVNWTFVPQPGPTPISNITFDIALRGDEVWIASFAGGLRRSTNLGLSWEIVPPDSFIFDPATHLNHRVFSVIVADSILWVGTAGGVNRSNDGGSTWTRFSHQNQLNPISGNFVVAIGNQRYADKDIIWAATRETTVESGDDTEFRGISWSEDQGFTWRTALSGETVHNFAFDDSVVYAASDHGLYKSIDNGETWAVFPEINNATATRSILTDRFFSAGVSAEHTLWAGTANGLGKTVNNGETWEVFQIFRPTGSDGEPRTYAYPNPFSPSIHNSVRGVGHVRFQYNTTRETSATIKIYDFSMRLVTTVAEAIPRSANGDFYETWDGTDDRGRRVDNGVYFYRLELAGEGTFWGKLIVLN
jgi:ligand-binding sensor domain-containing protein